MLIVHALSHTPQGPGPGFPVSRSNWRVELTSTRCPGSRMFAVNGGKPWSGEIVDGGSHEACMHNKFTHVPNTYTQFLHSTEANDLLCVYQGVAMHR